MTASVVALSLVFGTTVSAWQAVRATQAEAQATANEAKAKSLEQNALAAVASERAAKEAESAQRKQAEESLEAALKALDQMLANVNDSELNDIPRIGPLRRKLLNDARDFIQRIPIPSQVSPEIRLRVAESWRRFAELHLELDEGEKARQSYQTGIDILIPLIKEMPHVVTYRVSLANMYSGAGWCFYDLHSFKEAEKSFRRSNEVHAELAREQPKVQAWIIRQSRDLCSLSIALTHLDQRAEALIQASRALSLAESVRNPVPSDRANILLQLARLYSEDAPDQSAHYYRRAIEEYRAHVAQHRTEYTQTKMADKLNEVAIVFAQWHPDEAEKLWDESISIYRELCGNAPRVRTTADVFIGALLHQARLQRRLASQPSASATETSTASRLLRAETIFQEAMQLRRSNVSRFQLVDDRFQLVQMLYGEADYLLGNDGLNEDVSGQSRLRADALLTEAIQLCRALAAEFPNNADYKSRLAALLKLQSDHFSQKPDAAKKPAQPK